MQRLECTFLQQAEYFFGKMGKNIIKVRLLAGKVEILPLARCIDERSSSQMDAAAASIVGSRKVRRNGDQYVPEAGRIDRQ
ncbi:hypothetical protein WS87_13310 [Burkholderia sp. MSMB0856]|nr:hypothetical protein WS87_13310 [Burkholderia sp. MSMB0856]KVH29271.1 hypothetical protein WS87_27880 [Burkholderia sp. MSMB0856]